MTEPTKCQDPNCGYTKRHLWHDPSSPFFNHSFVAPEPKPTCQKPTDHKFDKKVSTSAGINDARECSICGMPEGLEYAQENKPTCPKCHSDHYKERIKGSGQWHCWDCQHTEVKPNSPAPSAPMEWVEGPYEVKKINDDCFYVNYEGKGVMVPFRSSFEAQGHCNRLNAAHAQGRLAERNEIVEKVKSLIPYATNHENNGNRYWDCCHWNIESYPDHGHDCWRLKMEKALSTLSPAEDAQHEKDCK